jgi:hypothetical protein
VSDTNELDRLRADLEAIGRYFDDKRIFAPVNLMYDIKDRIAKLEAEAADPWADAKRWVDEEFQHFGAQHCVAGYVRHLEAENAKQAARIAELGRTAQEWGRAGNHRSESSLIVPDDLRTRIDVYEERIAELEARPVPPLDAKRVLSTASIIARKWGRDESFIEECEFLAAFDEHGMEIPYEVVGFPNLPPVKAFRPVPPLDPKRVIATACKVIAAIGDKFLAACLMQRFKAGDAGIYPLAGDETT